MIIEDHVPAAKGPVEDVDPAIPDLLKLLAITEWLLEIVNRLPAGDDGDDHQGANT